MRRGFSIIELIFTIVILAICTMAIPRIVSQTTESTSFAIKQELVLNAKTLMAQILKSPWDSSYKNQGTCATTKDSSACALTNNSPIPIYTIAGGNFMQRPGIDSGDVSSSRRFNAGGAGFTPASKKKFKDKDSSFGFAGRYNDIDDYDGFGTSDESISKISTNLVANTTGDFILNTQLQVDVKFVDDGMAANGNTRSANLAAPATNQAGLDISNIKMIEVRAQATGGQANSVVLRSYAFNIGITFPRRRAW